MRPWLVLLLLPLTAAAQAPGPDGNYGSPDRQREVRAALPQYPKSENYLPFEVSATTPFSFFVDSKSISVGSDSVVRYTLIAKSPDGGLNVSFEGMRCPDGNYRVYAYGGAGNSWLETRNSKWETIRADRRNTQRAVLYNDYFCPLTGNIWTAADAVRALKSGGNARAINGGY